MKNNNEKHNRDIYQDLHDIVRMLACMFASMEEWKTKIEDKITEAYRRAEERRRKEDGE